MKIVVEEIITILDIFEEVVPDKESNRFVRKFCEDEKNWPNAKELFSNIRDRNLQAISNGDKLKECQYCLEEVVTQMLFNQTNTDMPFDPDSPYWVLKNALALAKKTSLPTDVIVDTVT